MHTEILNELKVYFSNLADAETIIMDGSSKTKGNLEFYLAADTDGILEGRYRNSYTPVYFMEVEEYFLDKLPGGLTSQEQDLLDKIRKIIRG
jgi:hypothetical protein